MLRKLSYISGNNPHKIIWQDLFLPANKMKYFKSILLLLFLGVVIIFIIQNLEFVVLNFLFWKTTLSLSFVSVSFYILGAFSGGIVFSIIKRLSSNSDEKVNK